MKIKYLENIASFKLNIYKLKMNLINSKKKYFLINVFINKFFVYMFYNPILMHIIIIIIYILLFIYLAEPTLCQGETLVSHSENMESLKACLESDILEYQKANEDHKQ
jgi:hypothetical protein